MATFEELNPYASPRGIIDGVSVEFGVGVWRDGELLVIHPKATLPPFCIKTGEPTRHHIDVTLDWTYPIDWHRRSCKVHVPLAFTQYHREFVVCRRIQFGCSLCIALCLLFLFVEPAAPVWCYRVIGWSIPAAVLILIFSNKDQNRFLKVARHQNGYLWLKGADRAFLEKVPDWGGGPE